MATVYQAVQEGPHGFENEVAIKLVHGDLIAAYPHILKMLVDEARIAARIKHLNVVRILDLVEEKDRFYMVMDFVDGLSMRQVLDFARDNQVSIPLGPIIEVLAAACKGLHAAHQLTRPDGTSLGLVHRDVKPGNILVSIDGEVKVSDFGIALFGDRLAESTAHGQLKGTPAYMSPEQVMGEQLDPRSDIFSMGLTLYTLATTRLAFSADTPMKIAMKIAREPLDDHAEELDDMLPGLGEVLARATAHDPAERYQSAKELGEALTEVHRSIASPTPIREMLEAAGWRPATERGEPVGHILTSPGMSTPASLRSDVAVQEEDEEEETDPGLVSDAGEPTEAPTVDEPAPGSEPTADHPGPAASLDADGPIDPAATVDPEATPPPGDESETVIEPGPVAPPVEVLMPGEAGFQPAPPPRPIAPHPGPPPNVRPGPGAPTGPHPRPVAPPPPPAAAWTARPPGTAPPRPAPAPAPPPPGAQSSGVHVRAQQTLPPDASASASHRRVQPLRDYRGRVVRKPPPPPESTRVGGLEKLGVALAFMLLALTVGAIVLVQLKAEPPGDPRFIDGETVISQEAASAPATSPAPSPSPAAVPAVVIEEDAGPAEAASAKESAAATPAPVASKAPVAATPAPTPAPRSSSKGSPRTAADPEPTTTPAPAVKGSLTVNTYPWSQVYVDGKDRGRTPLVGMSLRAGTHTVRLVFPTRGDEEMTQTVTVEPGKEAKVVHRITDDAP